MMRGGVPGIGETYGGTFDNGHAIYIAHLLHIIIVISVVLAPPCTAIDGDAGG